GGLPLLGRDVPVTGETGPVRLDERTLERIPEGLRRSVGMGLTMAGSNVRRLRLELDGHFGHPLGDRPPAGETSRGLKGRSAGTAHDTRRTSGEHTEKPKERR